MILLGELLKSLLKKRKTVNFNIFKMSYFEEEKMKAIAMPNELSDHSAPDGTPLTNFEYLKELNNPYR